MKGPHEKAVGKPHLDEMTVAVVEGRRTGAGREEQFSVAQIDDDQQSTALQFSGNVTGPARIGRWRAQVKDQSALLASAHKKRNVHRVGQCHLLSTKFINGKYMYGNVFITVLGVFF